MNFDLEQERRYHPENFTDEHVEWEPDEDCLYEQSYERIA